MSIRKTLKTKISFHVPDPAMSQLHLILWTRWRMKTKNRKLLCFCPTFQHSNQCGWGSRDGSKRYKLWKYHLKVCVKSPNTVLFLVGRVSTRMQLQMLSYVIHSEKTWAGDWEISYEMSHWSVLVLVCLSGRDKQSGVDFMNLLTR